MINMGKIVALSVSNEKGMKKSNVEQVSLIENFGIEGDIHAGDWDRQVSLLSIESINKMRMHGLNVRPGDFAENITTESFDLSYLSVGDKIKIGNTELEITQIGKECHEKCNIYYIAGDCVMPKEGVFARVIKGGIVKVGDLIQQH